MFGGLYPGEFLKEHLLGHREQDVRCDESEKSSVGGPVPWESFTVCVTEDSWHGWPGGDSAVGELCLAAASGQTSPFVQCLLGRVSVSSL